MARRKRSVRRYFSRSRTVRRAKRSMLGGGVIGNMVAGAVIGAGISLAAPSINSYVPQIAMLKPTTVVTLGGGLVAKTLLHKGGNFITAAVTIGTAMAASDFMGGMNGTTAGAGMPQY